MANDTPAQSLFQKVKRYFNLFILFINGQNMVINDVNWWKTDFWPPNHCRIIFSTMSPLFSQMSPFFQDPWDIHVIPPWSSWRLQEMSHKILLKYITFYQNFKISRKWMKKILIYSIHFLKTSRKWKKNLPDASLKFIKCMLGHCSQLWNFSAEHCVYYRN